MAGSAASVQASFERANQHDVILAGFTAEIPRQATVSAMSDLVPHLSNRDTIYLFPVVNDAEVILFDSIPSANYLAVHRPTMHAAKPEMADPLSDLRRLWPGARGEDGVLLLQRGYDTARNHEAIRRCYRPGTKPRTWQQTYQARPGRRTGQQRPGARGPAGTCAARQHVKG